MLRPDARTHLLELLRPPAGYDLDQAVGTTYSLDLLTALTVPLAFALFDWEHDDGKLREDPLALLEALRLYGEKLTIFCQAGRIRLPKKYPALVAWLESSIFQVSVDDGEGVFHPKVWALRFTSADGSPIRYRLLCLTRNLTFDRCWDTAVALDGELIDRDLAISANHPLADFFAELPKLSEKALPDTRKKSIARIASEMRRVKFELPEGFEEYRFWHGGLSSSGPTKCWTRCDQVLIVAPFISDDVLQWLARDAAKAYLVSRLESLQALQVATIPFFKTIYTLESNIETEETAQDEEPAPGEVLEGLHAKLFVADRGWNASVFAGSFNATNSAFYRNVEFMVELIGKKSQFGVTQFLEQAKGETKFVDLLCEYRVAESGPEVDATAVELERLLTITQNAIIACGLSLTVDAVVGTETFDLTLRLQRPLKIAKAVGVTGWPITLPSTAGRSLESGIQFEKLSYPLLTSFFAVQVVARVGVTERRQSFVLNLPLDGAPEDRLPRLLGSLIANKDQLLRYLLFMLASSTEEIAERSDLIKILAEQGSPAGPVENLPCLFESLIRTLHRHPLQLDRLAKLLEELGHSPDHKALLTDDFKAIWEPIWEAKTKAEQS
jgi:hypothetical protein